MIKTTFTIHVHSPDATAVVFSPSSARLISPVPRGTVLGTLSIQPSGWGGDVAASGADAAFIGVDAQLQMVALQDLTDARDYAVTVTATS